MGLAASQARLLLLTAKNDSLELQAQKISNERLLLAQEQETIAQEYSDATSNTCYYCSVTNADGTTAQETLTLETLAKSLCGAGSSGGTTVVIADSNGKMVCSATASSSINDSGDTIYSVTYTDSNGKTLSDTSGLIMALNTNGYNTALQLGLQNGSYQLYIQDDSAEEVQDGYTTASYYGKTNDEGNPYFVRKSPESLSSVSSRYYTEDDAAAQAEYQVAMARVNAMDTKLENRLNQVETQKSAVETEMESVGSIIDSNVERTFQYFS